MQGLRVTLAEVYCPLVMLVNVHVEGLWGEAIGILGLVQAVMMMEEMVRSGAVTRTLRRAVGHQAGLQAAVPTHGTMQVESSDQWLSNVYSFVPVNGIILHG